MMVDEDDAAGLRWEDCPEACQEDREWHRGMDFVDKVAAILLRWEVEWFSFAGGGALPADSEDLSLEILDLVPRPAFAEAYADLYPPA